ncbi:MAG: ABC transporter ATP-binding protein [Firmicutes bacterium]|nr:ABC transporter ATP-binding protein [Bacillota bacterium]
MTKPILEIKDLSVVFHTDDGNMSAVRNLSMSIGHGEIVAVVGESGCGKSVLCKTILGLLPKRAVITTGSIRSGERILTGRSDRGYGRVRGRDISMVFQDPMTSLDPSQTIGIQIGEAIRVHDRALSKNAVREKVIGLLEAVGIDRASERADAYPWMLSGGMRQRCVLAMALSQDPGLLIADEPTTALDVTVQTEILDLLRQLRDERGLSVLFISHDLGACARIADTIHIMYAGRIVESGTAEDVMLTPAHPYTRGLLRALPAFAENGKLRPIPGAPPQIPEGFEADAFAERNEYALGIDYVQAPPFFEISKTHRAATWLADPRAPKVPDAPLQAKAGAAAGAGDVTSAAAKIRQTRPVLLEVKDLSHRFPLGRGSVQALDHVSFDIRQGEVFSLVGESGSGKSTLARCLLRMIRPTEGEIIYDRIHITDRRQARAFRSRLSREIQFISQDPGAALDARMTVRDIIAEPLRIHRLFENRRELDDYIASMLREVQLDENLMDRYPAQLSGGQKQRASIARAYSMNPKLLIADEPLSSLDVSIQAQIIELFLSLQKQHDTALLFISHDLSMVRLFSDRVGVMYGGQMVEQADTETLFGKPSHPYTRALLSAVPIPDPRREKQRQLIRYEGPVAGAGKEARP